MNEIHHLSRQDRPIATDTLDQLDRGPFVESLARALVVDELASDGKRVGRRATGYVVGLTGRWGLGKSSILNLLAAKLGTMDQVIVAQFNPWLFRGRDELVSGFFNALRAAMGRSNVEEAKALVGLVEKYWGAINAAGHGVAAFVDMHGGAGAATTGWKTWGPRLRSTFKTTSQTPDEERKALEGKIARLKCAVVVLIDELDRIEDDEVRAVAQLVKAVGDIKGISYLVAYDQDRVVQALGRGSGNERRISGEHYLEKIIQYPIPLRPLFETDVFRLIEVDLADYGIDLDKPVGENQKSILEYLVRKIETPREVKRTIGAFSVLERAVRGEICPYDVLAYSWISTKSPSLRETIASMVDHVVNDPTDGTAILRAFEREDGKLPEVTASLGPASAPHEGLIKLLFPVFGTAAEGPDGDRLFRRRNLVRMLFLGNPPGAIPKADIEALWAMNGVALSGRLTELRAEGRLAAIIDRLDDLLPLLPEAGDASFWTALAKSFVRSADWMTGPEADRALAEDAGTALYRLALRDVGLAKRFESVFESLIASGDLVVAPWLLRKHLFAHGMTVHGGARGGEILHAKRVEGLLDREVPRYLSAIKSGFALRRIPTIEAVYVLVNTGNWGDDLRRSLTNQASTPEAIATVAGLFVPPGYGVKTDHLNEIFDVEEVRAQIEKFSSAGNKPSDVWLAACWDRLRRVLAREDPDEPYDG